MRLYESAHGWIVRHNVDEDVTNVTLGIIDAEGASVLDEPIPATIASKVATAQIDSLPAFGDYTLIWIVDGDSYEREDFSYRKAPYATAAQVRAACSKQTIPDSMTDEEIMAKVEIAEDIFDTAAKRSFTTCGAIEHRLITRRNQTIRLDHIDIQDVTVTVDDEEIEAGVLSPYEVVLTGGKKGVATIRYTYGRRVMPSALAHVTALYVKYLLGASSIDPRATGQQNDYGYVSFSVAGKNGATGIPEVDAFLSANTNNGGHGDPGWVIG